MAAVKPCGTRAAYGRGCRCDQCKKANSDYLAAWAEKRRSQGDFKHGLNGYDNYDCRCAVCKEARAKAAAKTAPHRSGVVSARRARRNRGEESAPEQFAHGMFGYREWACRCEVCVSAKRAFDRRHRARREERAGSADKKWQYWTGAELAIVAEHADMPCADLAALLSRSPKGVEWARALLREDPSRARVAGAI